MAIGNKKIMSLGDDLKRGETWMLEKSLTAMEMVGSVVGNKAAGWLIARV